MNKTNDDNTPSLPPDEQTDTESAAHDAQVAAMLREIDDLKDKLLRSAADYQNMARRTRQDVAEAREQQLTAVAKPLVQVMDHFDRALAVDSEKVSAQSILHGLQIVHDELHKLLEGFGVRRMRVQPGDEFDPVRHEALMRQKAQGIPADHVAAVLQPGYILHDRTLRAAQVSVAE